VFPTLAAAGLSCAYPWAEGAFARELERQRARRPRATLVDRSLDLRAVAQLDAVLANSSFTADAVRRIYARDAVVCHPGVEVAAARTGAGAQPHVAWVTNPRVAKNALGFFAALRIALEQEPGLAVRAIGLDGALRERVRASGLAGALTALEPLDDGRYAELLAGARFVAVPNIDEPFGLVPLEAMAHSRAVLAANEGGPAESVVAGVTGVHVNPLDPTAIARELVALWRDPARCAALGRAGRERYEREFTLARFADRFLAALQPSRA
jgi:glycosyltransferase involved in cell wall biosynthesis